MIDLSVEAEFYDIAGLRYWKPRAPVVTKALAGARDLGLPIVDIGAGTGLAIELIGTELSEVPIIAIEPAASMRAVLTSRLLTCPEIARRVTIEPSTFAETSLPAQIGGVIACGVIGYLTPAERDYLWKLLAERLPPGGRAVVEGVPFPVARTIRPVRLGWAKLGPRTHEIWMGSKPAADGRIELSTTCRVLQDGHLLRESVGIQRWYAVGMDDITAEAASAGLTCSRLGHDLAILSTEQCSQVS